MDISPEALNTQDTTYQMIPKKKGGEGPGPGKAWSSIVGEYQDREVGGTWLGMGGGKRDYGTYGEVESRKGNIIWNVNKEYRK